MYVHEYMRSATFCHVSVILVSSLALTCPLCLTVCPFRPSVCLSVVSFSLLIQSTYVLQLYSFNSPSMQDFQLFRLCVACAHSAKLCHIVLIVIVILIIIVIIIIVIIIIIVVVVVVIIIIHHMLAFRH